MGEEQKNKIEQDQEIWLKMLRSNFKNYETKNLWKFRRFYGISPNSDRDIIYTHSLRKLLNKYLTKDPVSGKRIELEQQEIARENHARTLREYAKATAELLSDPPEIALAWLERVKAETSWMDTEEYRKIRGRSILTSFAGIFISVTGLYPTKIEALGIQFSTSTHVGFILAVMGIIWYNWASTRILVRDYLIEITILELHHRITRKYKNYSNRWGSYIYWQYAEKSFFYSRLPAWIASTAFVCLLISLLRTAL